MSLRDLSSSASIASTNGGGGGEDQPGPSCEGSPVPASRSLRRRPVPTPRSTLRKPGATATASPRNQKSGDRDSQGQTSFDSSTSPDDEASSSRSRCADNEVVVDGEDILAALEKIPGVGSLRSLQQSSSLGSSLPSLDAVGRIKREEESSHSLELQSGCGSGQLSERIVDVRHNMRSYNTDRPRRQQLHPRPRPLQGQSSTEEDSSPMSKPTSPSKSFASGGIEEDEEGEDACKRNSADVVADSTFSKKSKVTIQTRPLPDLPKIMSDEDLPPSALSSGADVISVINGEEGGEDVSIGGGVYSTLMSPEGTDDHYSELREGAKPSESASLLTRNGNGLTLTGTMRKGRLKPRECLYDVQLSFQKEHLYRMEKKVHDKHHDRCFCGLQRGVHVFLFSVLSLPFLWVYCTALAFYLGTITWYNIFLYYNEDRGCFYKLLSPSVLLIYPLWIVPVTLFLGLYGAFAQVSWYFDSWLQAVWAPDGGFFGWFCNFIDIPDSSPYQVILLSASDDDERLCTGVTML